MEIGIQAKDSTTGICFIDPGYGAPEHSNTENFVNQTSNASEFSVILNLYPHVNHKPERPEVIGDLLSIFLHDLQVQPST